MQTCFIKPWLHGLALMVVIAVLAACGGTKPDMMAPANIPSSFDVTILSSKGDLFDYDGAPLTEQDLESALRYRKDQGQPTATIVMKRGDNKLSKQHIVSLARVAYNLKIKAYIDDDGEISELRAQLKSDNAAPEPKAGKHGREPRHQR
ncbi:MAG: hypothetical protein WB784_01775 [Rhodanobacteraceae bacterium]